MDGSTGARAGHMARAANLRIQVYKKPSCAQGEDSATSPKCIAQMHSVPKPSQSTHTVQLMKKPFSSQSAIGRILFGNAFARIGCVGLSTCLCLAAVCYDTAPHDPADAAAALRFVDPCSANECSNRTPLACAVRQREQRRICGTAGNPTDQTCYTTHVVTPVTLMIGDCAMVQTAQGNLCMCINKVRSPLPQPRVSITTCVCIPCPMGE